MKVCIITLVLFFALANCEIEEEDGILVLTDDNFDEVIADNQYVMVEFYAPWCGYCQAFALEYPKIAKILKEEGSDIRLAKIDATEENNIATKFSISSYPTMKFFKNGNSIDYDSEIEVDDILRWLKKNVSPPITLADKNAVTAFIESAEVAVIGFFKALDSDAARAFTKASSYFKDLPISMSSAPDVLTENSVDGDAVVLFKKFDNGRVDLTSDLTVNNIKEFISTNQLPDVLEFTEEARTLIRNSHIKDDLLLFISEESDQFKDTMEMYKSVAQEFKGKALFIQVNIDSDTNLELLEYFAVKADDCPAIRHINIKGPRTKYMPPTNELTPESISAFEKSVLDGTLQPHWMTEEIPEDWDTSPVKILVGKNFYEVAKDQSKDVFVQLYAPWCMYCERLAPIWDELGEKFKDNESVIIAKMDWTANEVKGISIMGFPTLKYFPKGSDEMVGYDDAHTLENLTKFVESGGKVIEDVDDQTQEEEEEEEEEEKEKDEL